jgi:hypothetical protein
MTADSEWLKWLKNAQFDAGGTLVTRYGPKDLSSLDRNDAAFVELTMVVGLARTRSCFPFLVKLTDAELAALITRGNLEAIAEEQS